MQLALNYSPQATELLDASRIEIDYFKTPPWPEMIAKAQAYRPVAVHFNLRAGTGHLHRTHWSKIEATLDHTAARYVNLHLAADIRDGLPFDPDDPSPAEIEQVIAGLHADVAAVVQRFGLERVIVENAPYRIGEGHVIRTCVAPHVIGEIIAAHGCGLLLDISHARISADALGMDAKDYIQALPLDRLRELHFTGLHDLGDGFLMDHLPVLDADWPWLEWIVKGINRNGWGDPHMVALEYGGEGHEFFAANSDIEVIARDVPRLYKFCHR
ncbi:MAG: DUF692 family protein [Chloroflexi bacterium]|nr:DUF692 family protein [Chloroflexota bacterium]